MIVNLKRYRIYLKSDQGNHKITTIAQNEETAIDMVLKAQNCPRNAIYRIKSDNKPVKI